MNPLLLSPRYFPSSVSSPVYISIFRGFPGGSLINNPTAKAGDVKILWRRKWQTTSVFLPGKSHGQRSLAWQSPWSYKRVRHNLKNKQQQCLYHSFFYFFNFRHLKKGDMDLTLFPYATLLHRGTLSYSHLNLNIYVAQINPLKLLKCCL